MEAFFVRLNQLSYPELDTSGQWHKITPSQGLSDLLLADRKEHTEE